MLAAEIDGIKADISCLAWNLEIGARHGSILGACYEESLLARGEHGDLLDRLSLNVDHIAVKGQLEDLGTHGGVEITLLECFNDGGIGQILGHDHGKAAEGVAGGMTEGLLVVVIIGAMAENALAGAKQSIVQRGIILHTVEGVGAVIAHLHGEESLICLDLLSLFH